jgi:DNA-binding NarL/FixJ family response regulator
MLLLANDLDCDALTLWFQHRLDWGAVESAVDLATASKRCRAIHPCLLVLDPAVAPDAVQQLIIALHENALDHLLILDRRPSETRLAEILHEPRISYLTRTAPPSALAAAIIGILHHNARAFDPGLAHLVRQTSKGYRLEHADENSLLVLLSARELQVMKMLAAGKSVPQCAVELGLSRSTVDNHKWRVMKKLQIHKASELTIRAIQEGIIHL